MGTGTTDYIEAGQGPRVILLHSSVAGARQWRSLMDMLADEFHVIAINLLGYGRTPAWDGTAPQGLRDQARLIEPFLPNDGSPVSLVGHSFGGSVAMKAAASLTARVRRLVLIEPNPFSLLAEQGKTAAYGEAVALRDVIKQTGRIGAWDKAAEVFAEYWTGPGSWKAMPDDRKSKFAQALRPNFHEWDAVMDDRTSLSEWRGALPSDTTVISARDTVRSISEIVALMQVAMPAWRFEKIDSGGHMAAMTRPDLINPIVARALR